MSKTKILSFLMSVTMLLSALSITGFSYGHNNDASLFGELYSQQDPDKSIRTVYLHAQGENPTVTPNLSTAYIGETTDIYFAVDNPNKGDYDKDEQTEAEKHIEPQYDLNGYTVKIYYNPAFFELVNDSTSPIDYTVPDTNIKNSGSKNEEVGSNGETENVDNLPEFPGYFPYKHGFKENELINGKTYSSAYATIFFSGSWLPMESEETDEEGNLIPAWYNLAKLPLKPLKTGTTEVFIDVDGADEFTLELFAKNTADEFSQTFLFDTVNGGHHQIIIKDKLKPEPPVPSPVPGKYTEKQIVTLKAEDGCDIYYSIEGIADNQKYIPGEKIEIDRTCTIVTYAKRVADERESNTVEYTYQIVPKTPLIYDGNSETSKLIPNVYTKDNAFEVYVAEKYPYGVIDDQNYIFYTFSDLEVDEKFNGNDLNGKEPNPEIEWVKVDTEQKIEVTKTRKVRFYTRNNVTGEVSDVAVYYLEIKPDAVVADPESGIYDEKQTIELTTNTKNAEIYYTLNGTDPIVNGLLYDPEVPITLYQNTTLRAVAKYEGVYSDISTFYYIFTTSDDYGVSAFQPSGVYEGSVTVTLVPYDHEHKVMYRIDDGKKWNEYTKSLVLDADTVIYAKAVDEDGNEGDEYKFIYKVRPLPPEFAPETTQFTTSGETVTVFSPESINTKMDEENTHHVYDLYYTIDGTDPINSKTRKHADGETDSAVISITGHTVISAVVARDGDNYSRVVTHSYDIVTKRPVMPVTTLVPGHYTYEIGKADVFTTQFMPVPEGINIYYTINYEGEFSKDPLPGEEGTILYNPGDSIDIKGHTIIKAVAVNAFGAKSDIGIFEYIITPEVPVAAPSTDINENDFPVVPVNTVKGSTVIYEIGGVTVTIENAPAIFYVDVNTGIAYKDPECREILQEPDEPIEITDNSATVKISAEKDGVSSEYNTYIYTKTDNEDFIAPPYADKVTGVYDEVKVIKGDDYTILEVKLYSLNSGDTIEYKYSTESVESTGNADGTDSTDESWTEYTESIKLKEDAILLIRAKRDDKYSEVATYIYNFVPLPPVITLPSGTYSTALGTYETKLELDPKAPDGKNYNIFYRSTNDKGDNTTADKKYNSSPLPIEYSMVFKAYVKNDTTGRTSTNAISYYILQGNVTSGEVFVESPFNVSRISAHLLSTGEYAKGIKLSTVNKDAKISYYYSYTTVDGKAYQTNSTVYDDATPIFVNNMEDITIVAKLLDRDGNEIADSERVFYIDFIYLGVPKTNLAIENPEKIEYSRYTEYWFENDHENEDNILLYYTLDGSNPTDLSNTARKIYTGTEEPFEITRDVTVRAVYFSACDAPDKKCNSCKAGNIAECTNGVYGEIGVYPYMVYSSGGGGGGGSSSSSRVYTVDFFGFEHPTHINYIQGYPDGSVKPDGNITREEMAAILYRVKNKQYDKPFKTTGEVFPDVEKSRWSVTEIEYMAQQGIIKGYPEGDFRPTGKLTRAEFAALIRRFTGLPDSEDENAFTDLSEEHWAYGDIMALYSAGFLNGYEDGTMRPEREITRAEVMKVMNIILGRKPLESYVKSLEVNPFDDLDDEKWYYVDVLEATITHNYLINRGGYEYKWEDMK